MHTKDVYPKWEEMTSSDVACSYLPSSRLKCLRMVYSGNHTDTLVASLGQAIMQAAFPRGYIAPTARLRCTDAPSLWF